MNVHATLIDIWRNAPHDGCGISGALSANDSRWRRKGYIQSERATQCLGRRRAEKERTQTISAAQGADAQCSCAGKGRVTGESQLRDRGNCSGRRAGDRYLICAGRFLSCAEHDQGQKAEKNGLEKCGPDKALHNVPPAKVPLGTILRRSGQAREHAGQVRS